MQCSVRVLEVIDKINGLDLLELLTFNRNDSFLIVITEGDLYVRIEAPLANQRDWIPLSPKAKYAVEKVHVDTINKLLEQRMIEVTKVYVK